MKKKNIVLPCLLLILFLMVPMSVSADAGVPYMTWTQGPGGMLGYTQTAYVPERVIQNGLNAPEDLFVDEDGSIYICDTGNGRVLILYADGSTAGIQGEELGRPTGIHVNKEHIYVVDYEKQRVLIYGKDLILQNQIERPKEAIFGKKAKFQPKKVLADQRGNVYVLSEGSSAGLMQFNPSGEFLGYFGSNSTKNSLTMILQRTFFTEEQLNKLFKNIPPSITNISIDEQGLIYTVTTGEVSEPVKKLNISGQNLYPSDMNAGSTYLDITTDANGNTFAVSSEGVVEEFDSYGRMLFGFGGKGNDKERMGVLGEPAAIDVSSDGKLYVLDKARNCVFAYKQTEFAEKVHLGIAMYKDGKYEESQQIWQEIKNMNSGFVQAYDALGKADYKKQNYDSALYNYELAENKEGYSQTYWIMRNEWLKNNLGTTVLILVVLIILWKALKEIDKRKRILSPVKNGWNGFREKPLVSQVFFVKRMLKVPMDGYYEMKFLGKASVASATFWYVWLFLLQLTGIYAVSYLFDPSGFFGVSIAEEFLKVAAPVALWIVCNYLVSTITDGEGKLRDIYCGTIYALSPYLVFALPLQLMTHVLTNNEAFIYSFGMSAIIAWSAVLFIMMVREIHDYTLGKTVKNMLVTLFTIVLFLLFAFILYLLFGQLRDFITSIIQEVAARG